MTPGPRQRPPLALTLPAIASALIALTPPAAAQAADPAKPATTGLERAQKQADAVFHWIKLNGEKGANRQTAAPAPAPSPAPAARKAPPAPAVANARTAPAPAPAPAQTAAAPSEAPLPAVQTAAAAPEPERAPVLLAAAAPTLAPTAPLTTAAQVSAPPTPAVEEAEVPLKLLVKVDPTLPRQMLQSNQRSGLVQVQFTVQPDGSVSQAQSMKASNARLAAVAVDAVKQWRFAPIAKAREAAVEVAFSNDN